MAEESSEVRSESLCPHPDTRRPFCCPQCDSEFDAEGNFPIQSRSCCHSVCSFCLDKFQCTKTSQGATVKDLNQGWFVDCLTCHATNAFHTKHRNINKLACDTMNLASERDQEYWSTLAEWHGHLERLRGNHEAELGRLRAEVHSLRQQVAAAAPPVQAGRARRITVAVTPPSKSTGENVLEESTKQPRAAAKEEKHDPKAPESKLKRVAFTGEFSDSSGKTTEPTDVKSPPAPDATKNKPSQEQEHEDRSPKKKRKRRKKKAKGETNKEQNSAAGPSLSNLDSRSTDGVAEENDFVHGKSDKDKDKKAKTSKVRATSGSPPPVSILKNKVAVKRNPPRTTSAPHRLVWGFDGDNFRPAYLVTHFYDGTDADIRFQGETETVTVTHDRLLVYETEQEERDKLRVKMLLRYGYKNPWAVGVGGEKKATFAMRKRKAAEEMMALGSADQQRTVTHSAAKSVKYNDDDQDEEDFDCDNDGRYKEEEDDDVVDDDDDGGLGSLYAPAYKRMSWKRAVR